MVAGTTSRARSRSILFAALALLACKSQSEPAPKAVDKPIEIQGSVPAHPAPDAEVQVAAAADLTRAFGEIGPEFEAQTKQKVAFTFGSSGLLTQQIRQGAPFDVFASANVGFTDALVKEAACDGATQARYARGRIVVWTKNGLVEPPKTLADLKNPRFKRIAIANPEHAPYGKAAQQALQKAGLWDALQPRIVFGENIKQTQQYAQSGNAEAAFVALALVMGTDDGTSLLIDAALHAPIDQALIVCNHGKNAAGGRAFAAFVQSEAGRAAMQRYGFELPAAPAAPAPAK